MLELPGRIETALNAGANSTTSAGPFDFSYVAYDNTVSGYSASFDVTTGLEAITFQTTAACHRRGTRIRTEQGDVPIEGLRIGDRIVTAAGGVKPIRWSGQRHDGRWAGAGDVSALPVLNSAGALGERGDFIHRTVKRVEETEATFADMR